MLPGGALRLPDELADLDLDAVERALGGPGAETAAANFLADCRRRRGFDRP
jgi:hypothetical protein